MLLIGLAAGLAFPALMMLAMSGVAPEDTGLASGLVNTSVQVGGAIGLAVLATLASERTGALQAAGEPAASALNAGFHLAYLIGAVLVAVAAVVAVSVLRSPNAGPAAAAEKPEPSRAKHRRPEPAWSEAA
jgi:MFS family permease